MANNSVERGQGENYVILLRTLKFQVLNQFYITLYDKVFLLTPVQYFLQRFRRCSPRIRLILLGRLYRGKPPLSFLGGEDL